MKKLTLLTLSLITSFGMINSAYAVDGVINFTGDITAQSCKIDGDTQGTKTVNLGSVPASALAAEGQTAGNQIFSMKLTECAGAATKVATHFESLALGSAENRLKLDSASTAKNVEIALYDQNGVLQPVNGTVPDASYIAITDNTATLNYIAAYYATGAATAGSANSVVSYTLSYQ
ncbi:fimbrial protein [Proteus sp. FME41]|uniref:fimbrial protein n=1 Tax=Proteus sp. FME41 TaxID=2742608 RepID=UPI0018672DDB|nr:fimbrial protein [Proteus sp. FME41]